MCFYSYTQPRRAAFSILVTRRINSTRKDARACSAVVKKPPTSTAPNPTGPARRAEVHSEGIESLKTEEKTMPAKTHKQKEGPNPSTLTRLN
jgi:hypothetical protein